MYTEGNMVSETIVQNNQILGIIKESRVFAVVRTDNAQKAIEISKALIEGGIKIIEIAAVGCQDVNHAISEISAIEGVSVAAGSVVTARQADEAIKAGAKLIVSPINELRLIKLCKGRKMPVITGAATPNEAYQAWKSGVNVIKIFPANDLGGPEYIKDILTPMPFLNLVPTGGVNYDNFTDYLDAGAYAVGLGKTLYAYESSMEAVTEKARKVVEKLKTHKQSTSCCSNGE